MGGTDSFTEDNVPKSVCYFVLLDIQMRNDGASALADALMVNEAVASLSLSRALPLLEHFSVISPDGCVGQPQAKAHELNETVRNVFIDRVPWICFNLQAMHAMYFVRVEKKGYYFSFTQSILAHRLSSDVKRRYFIDFGLTNVEFSFRQQFGESS